jgi:hypothetical protein
MLASLGLALITLLAASWALFDRPLWPLTFFLILSDRLAAPHWPLAAGLGLVAAASVFLPPLRRYIRPPFRLAAILALSLCLPLLLVGTYVDILRRDKIQAFRAGHVIQHSFFRSVREAPREFQFFLHAAALKDCVPYAWSYRTMDFYVVPPDAAINVLPREWLERCKIEASR